MTLKSIRFCCLFLLLLFGHGQNSEVKSRKSVEGHPSSSLVVTTEQISNRFKPTFKECETYQPSVQEESKRGTKVIKVFAEDMDDSNLPSGQITYSIVSTNKKFTIDPKTGWLFTDAIFNRDEPSREKKIHVTIKASDNGRPQLEDICTLSVQILDINDNHPVFDRAVYDVVVPQDTPVGSPIMRISASDVDEGDNQKISYGLSAPRFPSDIDYFRLDSSTGAVFLDKKLDKPVSAVFELKANASDFGVPPLFTEIDITVEVVESNNKQPSFIEGPGLELVLSEIYNEYSKPIASYTAKSNIPGDNTVFFQLVSGSTEQTNKEGTFRAVQDSSRPQVCKIYLAKQLEYERVESYTLTLQVRNAPDLVAEAQLIIKVKDENNQAPLFVNIESGSVLEHENIGTVVMQVSATDNDGTYPNNKVTYRISDTDMLTKFKINPDSGVITSLVEFDREERAVYSLTVIAEDGAPSALLKNDKPNATPMSFRIAIADINDNAPYFPHQNYSADVPEDQDLGSKVIEVSATDLDTEASITTYSIKSGNVGGAFSIEKQTGFIRVAKALDYESIKEYDLIIQAWDGKFSSEKNVQIQILNVNDMKPVFSQSLYSVEDEEEERIPSYPILQVSATDPDIDVHGEQNITYYLDKGSQISSHFKIDEKSGQLWITKPLDRDAPNGFPQWTMYIFAKDENGGSTGIESFVQMIINLKDINDNAPYLDMPSGLVWNENRPPGDVGILIGDDFDSDENGAPFTFELESSDPNLKSLFGISRSGNGSYVLKALSTFDREEKKFYKIPIKICDVKVLCAVSILTLIIGDENDNPSSSGHSEIFVYNYEGKAPDTVIGRVFVNDPDDWDLPDKVFSFKNSRDWPYFKLDRSNGMITMKEGIHLPQEFSHYLIDFLVEDKRHGQVGAQAVKATVNITIQKLPSEAVLKSGSFRIRGSPEDFIRPNENGYSTRDRLTKQLSKILNASYVDIFTVLPSGDSEFTDVRFSAHGSPYFEPEKLENSFGARKEEWKSSLGLDIIMVKIDECMYENSGLCSGTSCTNYLDISSNPYSIFTNTSSFVGVSSIVKAECSCSLSETPSCFPNPCLNNGTCIPSIKGDHSYRCECPSASDGIYGDNCQILSASYNGQGWSLHPSFSSSCDNSHLSLFFETELSEGTLFYIGPSPFSIVENVTDFLALEMNEGKLKMFINLGSGTHVLSLETRVDDGKIHYVVLRWTNDTVQMELDDKSCSNSVSPSKNQCFLQISTHESKNSFLNVNGPLQVGGVSFGQRNFKELSHLLGLDRHEMPSGSGFAGCIRNLTFSAAGKVTTYNLGGPSDGENFTPGCDAEFVQAVTALRFNMDFIIAILVCLAIILTAIVILAVYKKKRSVFSDKDIDCDIRENIINYDDEGGGEGDQTGYDLSVLRMMSDSSPSSNHIVQNGHLPSSAAPDIQSFLQNNKDRIDDDPEGTPFDDLRHYAYEGDGNSHGSLSSLNSAGSSDADLEFDYLHNFGPRFKKLADMYGEIPDSEDEEGRPSESWC